MAAMTAEAGEAVVVALAAPSFSTIFVSACGVLVVILIWSVLEWIWWRPKKLESLLRQQGLSGNPYRLYYGDLRDASRMLSEAKSKPMDSFCNNYMPRVRPFLYQTIKNYGKNCFFWDGPVPVVNVGDADLMREVFNRHNEFQKSITNPVISRLFIKGLVAYEGDKWARHRKLINPAFHMEKLKLMVPLLYTSSNEIVSKWEKMLSQEPESRGKEVDVFPDLISLSADAISRAAFGSSFEEGGRIFQLIKDQIVVVGRMNLSVYFPGKRFLPTSDNKKMKELDQQIRTIIIGIIDKRRKLEKESKYDDLLGLLMANTNINKNNTKKQIIKVGLTTEELIQECKLFYLAGQETTSNLLTWTMLLLSKHQDWQTRAREEVLATFGERQPDCEGLNQLKVMNMIFHEVLRLYPPAVELRRGVVRDNTKLGKHLTLPKGVQINLPILFAHTDIDQWGDDPDPFEFNPERFSEGISKAASKYNKSNGGVAFLPFGWGPRICIGLNFAMIEAKLAFAMILQRFQFDLSPAYAHAPVSYATLAPQFGAHVILNHRRIP